MKRDRTDVALIALLPLSITAIGVNWYYLSAALLS